MEQAGPLPSSPPLPPSPYLRRWSRLLDSSFRVPGTRIRFGWDPILGVIPGLGDVVSPLFTVLLLGHAFRAKVPPHVVGRMLANVLLDTVAGAVPGVGDLLDVAWKANTRNLDLLERHMREGVTPGLVDRVGLVLVMAVLIAIVAVPVLAFGWVISRFGLI